MKGTTSLLAWRSKARDRLDPVRWVENLPTVRRRLTLFVLAPLALFGGACAVYLSWRGTGAFTTIEWMPDAIGQWADRNGRLRNFPAYFLLACPVLPIFPRVLSRAWAAVVLGAFGAVLELAEYFIPGRMVEWQDITWSWAGVIVAWLLIEGAHWLRERSGSNSPCQQPS